MTGVKCGSGAPGGGGAYICVGHPKQRRVSAVLRRALPGTVRRKEANKCVARFKRAATMAGTVVMFLYGAAKLCCCIIAGAVAASRGCDTWYNVQRHIRGAEKNNAAIYGGP